MADLEETLKSSPKFLLPKLASMRTAQWRCTRPQVENSGEWLEEPSQCGRSAWRWFARRRGPWMVVRRSWWASSLHPSCAAWAGTRSYQTENYHMHEVTMLLANRNIHMSVFTGLQNSFHHASSESKTCTLNMWWSSYINPLIHLAEFQRFIIV